MNCPYNIKVCTKCKRILVACKINFNKGSSRSKYGLKSICKICEKENQIKYKESKKIWREKNPNYFKQYYQDNKEKILQNTNNYYYENREDILINQNNKRRQLEEEQGRGITKEQWYEMMEFFNWCCAYSSEYIGGDSKNRTIDHIVPLSEGGLNEPWNCIPCYDNYNFKKGIKDMEQWYRQQEYFSEERLIKIYAWCKYAYEKWSEIYD